jgi:hypothetical protein
MERAPSGLAEDKPMVLFFNAAALEDSVTNLVDEFQILLWVFSGIFSGIVGFFWDVQWNCLIFG